MLGCCRVAERGRNDALDDQCRNKGMGLQGRLVGWDCFGLMIQSTDKGNPSTRYSEKEREERED